MSNRETSIYTPVETSTYKVPDTITMQKKKPEAAKNKWITILLSFAVWVLMTGLILYKLAKPIYITGPLVIASMYGFILLVRYVFLNEAAVSESMEYYLENDFLVQPDAYWNIYDIEDKAPYVVSYINGMRGVFLRLHKDAVVGKGSDARYKHYKGVELMYREALSRGLYIVNIDIMSEVAEDVDLEPLYEFFGDSDIPLLQGVMDDIIGYSKRLMTAQYAKNDIMLLLGRGTRQELEDGYRAVIAAARESNYHKVTFEDKSDIQQLAKSIYNLEQFSINDAMRDTLSSLAVGIIKPIRVEDLDGTVLETFGEFSWDLAAKLAQAQAKGRQVKAEPTLDDVLASQYSGEAMDIFDEQTGFISGSGIDARDASATGLFTVPEDRDPEPKEDLTEFDIFD